MKRRAIIGLLSATIAVPVAALEPLPYWIELQDFQCHKMQDEIPPTGFPIHVWGVHGGPQGAVWNADELYCTASVKADCDAGKVTAQLRVGSSPVMRVQLVIKQPPKKGAKSAFKNAFVFHVPYAKVAANFDSPEPKKDSQNGSAKATALYRTAQFRLTATLDCQQPLRNRGNYLYPSVVANRSFIAGFASGE